MATTIYNKSDDAAFLASKSADSHANTTIDSKALVMSWQDRVYDIEIPSWSNGVVLKQKGSANFSLGVAASVVVDLFKSARSVLVHPLVSRQLSAQAGQEADEPWRGALFAIVPTIPSLFLPGVYSHALSYPLSVLYIRKTLASTNSIDALSLATTVPMFALEIFASRFAWFFIHNLASSGSHWSSRGIAAHLAAGIVASLISYPLMTLRVRMIHSGARIVEATQQDGSLYNGFLYNVAASVVRGLAGGLMGAVVSRVTAIEPV